MEISSIDILQDGNTILTEDIVIQVYEKMLAQLSPEETEDVKLFAVGTDAAYKFLSLMQREHTVIHGLTMMQPAAIPLLSSIFTAGMVFQRVVQNPENKIEIVVNIKEDDTTDTNDPSSNVSIEEDSSDSSADSSGLPSDGAPTA